MNELRGRLGPFFLSAFTFALISSFGWLSVGKFGVGYSGFSKQVQIQNQVGYMLWINKRKIGPLFWPRFLQVTD